MPSDNAALVIACISGAVSLAAAGGVELSRRRTARELQELQSEQDTKRESLRAEQTTKLEEFKDELARSREAATKAQEAAHLVAKYRDPLLWSAFDLQSRIFNIYRPGGFRGGGQDPGYLRLNTLFLLAEFLGWLEIIRREMQFLDLGAVQATKDLRLKIEVVQDLLATTLSFHDDCYVYRGQQRAIGELMLSRVDADVSAGRRHECIGYAAFVSALEAPEFNNWFERLGDALERLPTERPARLVAVQHALIELLDFLDPEFVRFQPDRRQRLDVQN
jgi:hypothetical protein